MRRILPHLLFWMGCVWTALAQAPHESWQRAEPGYTYTFPEDEFAHPDFKTEWWYFTGNLFEPGSGRRFGYQLTFFRQGVRPPSERVPAASRFVINDIWFAHFAISDLKEREFFKAEQISRGAFGEAGSGDGQRIVWIEDWELRHSSAAAELGHYQMVAETADFALNLVLETTKPAVFHGEGGVSAKSPDPKNASHYVALTSLASKGTIRLGNREFTVEGKSWYDREWSTSLLGRDQVGWDWFAIQFEDDAELMLFQLRDPEGNANFSSGTYIAPDGSTRSLKTGEFTLKPGRTWTSPETGGVYPMEWEANVPSLDLNLKIRTAFDDQELRLNAISYWEGATIISGKRSGRGYLEMTGYSGRILGLSESLEDKGE